VGSSFLTAQQTEEEPGCIVYYKILYGILLAIYYNKAGRYASGRTKQYVGGYSYSSHGT
jgi:hypothetical protein